MRPICCLAALAAIVGCARQSDWDRYVPAEPLARQALEAALAAWKDGQPPGAVSDRSPKVQVVDSMRRAGQRLADYENLGEFASDGRRGFLVRLRLENPQETRKVRFCVVGIDPLWVFREEELDMIGHWTCAAPEDQDKTKEPQNDKQAEDRENAPNNNAPNNVAKKPEEPKP